MTLKWLYINDYDGSGDKGAVAGGGRRGVVMWFITLKMNTNRSRVSQSRLHE